MSMQVVIGKIQSFLQFLRWMWFAPRDYSRRIVRLFVYHFGSVIHCLCRRVSLFRNGIRRPPFRPRYQRQRGVCNVQSPYTDALYLWPDRIRWHFWFMAFGLILSVIIGDMVSVQKNGAHPDKQSSIPLGFASPLHDQSIFGLRSFPKGLNTEQPYYEKLIRCGLLLFFNCLLVPWLIYYLFRIPVLSEITEEPATFLFPWFDGIADPKPTSWKASFSAYLKDYLPPFREDWDAVYWSPRGSPQEAVIRAAILDMYQQKDRGEILSVWNDRAFWRWLLYWNAPVWGGWAALVILPWITSCDPVVFTPPAFFCTIYSILFIGFQAAELPRWSRLDEQRRYSPFAVPRRVRNLSIPTREQIEGHIRTVTSIIFGTVFALYLSYVNYLCP